jgi:asparagine synthase (glutamine-hydrolysing)
MCGIAGFFHFDRGHAADFLKLKAMSETLRHRGPDEGGYFIRGPVALGHCRLTIIDTATGHQPMATSDGHLTIIFNGEIYNYLELREELRSLDHRFLTTSDTEVLVHAYEEWGTDLHRRLNGMWAFAIWDERQKQLFLSRDRVGEKPLHYSVWGGTFLFGSEIKALLAYGLPREANLDVLELYLSLGYVPAPFSFFKHVRKLLPGHYLLVRDGVVEDQSYWGLSTVDEKDFRTDKPNVYEEFEGLLKDSVRIRMRSDVPYGAFLSGGLDSSSVVALMSGISKLPVETFTIGFDEEEFDERDLARGVAATFKTNHHEHVVTYDSVDKSLDEILHHYDEPFGDSSAIPTGYVSEYAAKQVKMVLTGDGGDEVLSGYNAYQSEKLAHLYRMIPRMVGNIPLAGLKVGTKLFHGRRRLQFERIKRVLDTSVMDFNDRMTTKASIAESGVIRRIVSRLDNKAISFKDYFNEFMSSCPYRDSFYRLMYYNFKLSLPEDMLVKVDRMSMAHSLETRLPFLDHRLVELMSTVHKDVKMSGFERKTVLRRTIGKSLPQAVLKAPKKGFVVPLREWFKREQVQEELTRLMTSSPLDVDVKIIADIFRKNRSGEADYGNFIWTLFLLGRWFKE